MLHQSSDFRDEPELVSSCQLGEINCLLALWVYDNFVQSIIVYEQVSNRDSSNWNNKRLYSYRVSICFPLKCVLMSCSLILFKKFFKSGQQIFHWLLVCKISTWPFKCSWSATGRFRLLSPVIFFSLRLVTGSNMSQQKRKM